MMAKIVGLLILDMLVTFGPTSGLASGGRSAHPTDSNNSTHAFQKLSTLAGYWQATTPMGQVTASFEVMGSGSVLVERLEVNGKDPMVTVYHLDGNRLVLEHYCHTGNQPVMQAKPFEEGSNELDFDFVSAGSLASPQAGHMHQLKLQFRSADEVAADWIWSEDGKLGGRNVSLVYHRQK